MITSMPVSAQNLGLEIRNYGELARNTKRMNSLAPFQREEILKRAIAELPRRICPLVRKLLTDINYDREFYKEAGFKYEKGFPNKILLSAIADYLLRNKGNLNQDLYKK